MSHVPMTRPEEALAMHDITYHFACGYVERADGSILKISGTKFSTSDDGGITWSDPYECRDPDGELVQGRSMARLEGDAIGLSNCSQLASDGPRARCCETFRRSEDGGKTWGLPLRLSPDFLTVADYHDTMIRTSSGRLVVPVYCSLGQGSAANDIPGPWPGKLVKGQWVSTNAHFFDMGFTCSFVYYSDDDGATWQTNKDGELLVYLDYGTVVSYTNEPSVTEVEPGTLLMFLRTGLGRLFQAWSYDDGETWTRPEPTSLATSTAPGQIRTLPNGHLLAVWNQQSPEEIRRGYHRSRISTAISRNGGSVWEFFQNVTSLHEETRVEPGPIEPVRPEEYHYEPDIPAPEREAEYVTPTDDYGVWTYPSVLVLKDRVIISHRYYLYDEHETRAQLIKTNPNEDFHGFIEKVKVLPMSWLYGGKEPADHPPFSSGGSVIFP